jgi:CTP synthase
MYGRAIISERHRHRYEVNPDFIEQIEKAGLRFTGSSKDGIRMEVAELEKHPYFLATQFHPEFKSRPGNPSKVHFGLVKAAVEYNSKKL